ncbi:hypothetical protein SRABI106_03605 [Rahnella aquatilis]|nr:hypothetical protein SRABI106_03605 [Rahnella aquatilis]
MPGFSVQGIKDPDTLFILNKLKCQTQLFGVGVSRQQMNGFSGLERALNQSGKLFLIMNIHLQLRQTDRQIQHFVQRG